MGTRRRMQASTLGWIGHSRKTGKPLPSDSKISVREVIKHPIVLLVLGAVAGLLGQWVVSTWQRREWDRQQNRLLTVKNLDERYGLPEEILKATEQNASSIREYLSWLETREIKEQYGSDPEDHTKILIEVSRAWRTSAVLIKQKLKLFYKNQEIHSLFDQIWNQQEQISANTLLLHAEYMIDSTISSAKRMSETMRGSIEETKELLAKESKEIDKLISLMTAETDHDLKSQ